MNKLKGHISANIIILAIFLLLVPTVLVAASSAPASPSFSNLDLLALYPGSAQIEGEFSFNARLTPSVAAVGDTLSLQLIAKNDSPDPISPVIRILLPSTLEVDVAALPSGTALNLQNQELVWSPVLNGQGGSVEGQFSFELIRTDPTNPENKIEFEITHRGTTELTEVGFWAGALPTGSFSMNPERASVGQPVQLSATVSGNGPVNQTWTLGDGRQILASNPIIVFPEVGTHPVTLHLTNPAGTTTIEKFITVVPEPAAFISLSDSAPAVNEIVQFQSTGGGQQPLSYYWDFGDGTFSTDPNPLHQYPVAGTYTVLYTVQNEFGSAQNFVEVNVGTPPAADAIVPATGQVGAPLIGQAFAGDSVQTIIWDMGDGTILEGLDISHVYQFPGVYTVRMDAIGAFGTATISRIVEISAGRTSLYLPLVLKDMIAQINATDVGAETEVEAVASESAAESVNLLISTLAEAENDTEIVLVDNPEIAGADLAAQLYWYINEARRQAELGSVNLIPSLSVAAKQHTNDMATFKYTGHTGSDGTHPYERVARVGFREGGYAGETTAWGFRTPREAVEFWLNSPPHRLILLNPLANQVGVAHTTNYNGPNVWYWTAEFASTYGSIESQLLEAGIRTKGYIPDEPIAEDTIIFYWYWPLTLEADQTFSLYTMRNGAAIKIGSIREPINVDENPFDYGYPVQGLDLAEAAGETEWFVRLETLSGQQKTDSEVDVVTIFGNWPTPTAAPTLIPTPTVIVPVPVVVTSTSTPVEPPAPTPLGQTGPVINTPTPTTTATAVQQLPTALPVSTATPTPVTEPTATNTLVPLLPTSTPTPLPQEIPPTNTAVPPTSTNTPLPAPTNTLIPPTATETQVPLPTSAAVDFPTLTPTGSLFPATSTPAP
ncbi:MAG: PKD domain-containing protein [Anaerolineae bacterium]